MNGAALPPRSRALPLIVIGGICGLAWAAGLRGFMAEVAGPASSIDWVRTFEGILLPGVVAGALLGWAEHFRRTGGRPRWRWLALAPLAFIAPSVLVSTFTDGGIGGAAIGIPLFGMAGGYALSGRGPTWARAVTAAIAVVPIVGWVAAAPLIGGGRLAIDTPRGAPGSPCTSPRPSPCSHSPAPSPTVPSANRSLA